MILPLEIYRDILLLLPFQDVMRYILVCKTWMAMLNERSFWKIYMLKHFDLDEKSDLSKEMLSLVAGEPWECSDPEYEKLYLSKCIPNMYVMRPFPSMWNCGVFHPYGLDPLAGDVKTLQGLVHCLKILTYMKCEASRLGMMTGFQCSSSIALWPIDVIVFPWNKEELPEPLEIMDRVFKFHPEICKYYINHPEEKGQLVKEMLYFHVPSGDSRENDEDGDHDLYQKPCLNSIFGMDFPNENEQWVIKESREFYKWLQSYMYPSLTVCIGEAVISPYLVLMISPLAPGWLGGTITGVVSSHSYENY